MVASASRKAGMRLTVITEEAESLLVTADDVIGPVEALGKVRLPGTFQPKDRQYRREVAKRLTRTSLRKTGKRRGNRAHRGVHPVELDPDLRHRVRAAAQAERYERELAEIDGRVEGHNRSLGREFDRVVGVLEHRGYLVRPEEWVVTHREGHDARSRVP